MERLKKTRIGVYGILVEENKVLLTLKCSGCYVGQLDLPGGGIEFGETPDEALIRELREEIGASVRKYVMLGNYGHNEYVQKENMDFHHLAMVYRINGYSWIEDAEVEEEFGWYEVGDLKRMNLTPITRMALKGARLL